MNTLNAIIIGFGNIGYYYSLDKKRKKTWSHFEAFQKMKNVNLFGIVDKSKIKRDFIKKKFPKLKVYKSIDEVLMAKKKIDLFSICTPTETHYEMLVKLINYKSKIIICEKPLCSKIGDAKKILNLSKNSRSIIAVNYQRRFEKNFIIAKNIIKKGVLGKIKFINACYTRKILNIGTHIIDIIRMIVSSEISRTSSFFVERALKKDPSLSGLIFFKNKVCCSLQSIGNKFKYIFEIEIFCEKGKIRISDNGKKIEIYKFIKSKNFTGYFELKKIKFKSFDLSIKKLNDPMKELIKNSIDAYLNNSKIYPNVYDGYQNLLVAKAMENSALKKKVIKL